MSETIKVKKLRWKPRLGRENEWSAYTDAGLYEVGIVNAGFSALRRFINKDAQWADAELVRGVSAEQAKAFAQVDFEARILSALDAEAARRAKRNAEIAERY